MSQRVCRNRLRVIRASWALALAFIVMPFTGMVSAIAAPQFTGGVGGISFGVADLGPPVNPGAPLYLFNNFNLRNDILINPGLGLTADLSIINNTLSTGAIPFAPGQFIWATQVGGGNINGPFGVGGAVIRGDKFGFYLADGGVPGGISASYQIMSWDANFFDLAGSPVGTLGTFIAMKGTVPLVQDVALAALRTQLIGPNIGVVEVPGMIVGIERTGPLSFLPVLQFDMGVPGAVPMGWGGAIIVDNAVTGAFRALIYSVFPDLGVIDGLAIPAGELFQARVTATTIADPSAFDMFMPDPIADADLLNLAFSVNNVAFPSNPLFEFAVVPEAGSVFLALSSLLVVGGGVWSAQRKRRSTSAP